MKTGEALQIGGGNIGRALIGEVMNGAGIHVTFADVNEELVEAFNNERGYPVNVLSSEGVKEHYVSNVDAIMSTDEHSMVEHIVSADIIMTAVGPSVLPHVAPMLAKGLMRRVIQRPREKLHVAVVACENMQQNTHTLRDYILAELPDEQWRARVRDAVSFPNCAVDRIVPSSSGNADHPLVVSTEEYYQLAIDKNDLLNELPHIPGIRQVDDLNAVLAQKLFTLNSAHAAVAYWGHLKGYETIHESVDDTDIAALTEGLLGEVGSVVVRNYPSISQPLQDECAAKTLRRFKNPHLLDETLRVGRQPKRKLGSSDRLVKPATLAFEVGECTPYLIAAVVSGLRFRAVSDNEARQIEHTINTRGIEEAAAAITGLQRDHPIMQQVVSGYRLTDLMT